MMNVNKKVLCSLLALLLVFSALLPVSVLAASKETPITAARSGVVRIVSVFENGDYATGSGFGVGKLNSEPEYFITNAHVCLDANGNPAEKIYILLETRAVQVDTQSKGLPFDINNAMAVSCDIVNRREISLIPDVAILKAEKPVSGRTCLPLRESGDSVEAPQIVYALGYPGDLDVVGMITQENYSLAADIENVHVTQGVVSQKNTGDVVPNTNVIIHSAEISDGNSGGPLLDEKGAVVGINTYRSEIDGSHYFAIYIDYAIDVLKANGIEFALYKGAMDLKTIILCAAIVGIIAVAAIMFAGFNQKEKKLVKDDKEKSELRLQGMSGAFAGRRFPIDNQVTLGRSPSNNIVFPTSTEGVSGNHCVVINNNGQLYVKDTSTYGTFVNGINRLPKDQLVSVKVGDKISLGSENQSFIITHKGGKI